METRVPAVRVEDPVEHCEQLLSFDTVRTVIHLTFSCLCVRPTDTDHGAAVGYFF